MRIIGFVLVLFLVFAQNVLAQQQVEKGSLGTIRVDLEHITASDFEQNMVNRMLRSIAYAYQKPVESIHIHWELLTSYQVSKQVEGNFKSDIFIEPLAPRGYFNHYGFNSASYILPTLQSFRLQVFKEDSSLVYLKYFNQNPISVQSVGQTFTISHQRWAKGWYMEIDQFDFQYNTMGLSFEQWFQYTNDYKAANYFVDELLENYQKLQQIEQEPFPFLVKSLRQINYLDKLYEMPFYGQTILMKRDPNNLERKMTILSTLLDLNIAKYAPLFSEIGFANTISIDRLVEVYLGEEVNLMHLQHQYSSIYDDLFNQLAKTNYPNNLSHEDFKFTVVVAKNNSEGKSIIKTFENRLFEKSIFTIDKLIRDGDFSEALYTIDNLERFVEHAEALKLNTAYKQFKAMAAYGMYNSYVEIVEKAINIKNTRLAVQYLEKASDIQEYYSNEIITNGLVEKKLDQLLALCYSDYNNMLEQDRYSEAAAKRDTIRGLITDFQLEAHEEILDQLNAFDNLKIDF